MSSPATIAPKAYLLPQRQHYRVARARITREVAVWIARTTDTGAQLMFDQAITLKTPSIKRR